MTVAGPSTAHQTLMDSPVRYGVLFDVDGVLRPPSLRHLLRQVAGVLNPATRDRRSVLGMAGMLQQLVAQLDAEPVYITAAPHRALALVRKRLADNDYPAGPLVCTAGSWLAWLLGRHPRAQQQALSRVLEERPGLRWVLVGDDGRQDPDLFTGLVAGAPGRIGVIALRQVASHRADDGDRAGLPAPDPGAGVPVVRAPNAQELLALLRAGLGLTQPRGDGPGGAAVHWLLTAAERGNRGTALRAWTDGNAVRALAHGRSYFPVLADALQQATIGDLVALIGWRADADEPLQSGGPRLADALSTAARRGALVRGLLWRSHANGLGYSARENRELALRVNAAGGQVLLDQRHRALGSHHQKLAVIRRRLTPPTAELAGDTPSEQEARSGDVAFLGGIDLAHGRGDDAGHAGDPLRPPFNARYGPRPAWHDVQLELHGPVVRDAEDTFRERWQDPAPLSRLPWHVLPDLVRGVPRAPLPLPSPAPDPPAAGSCAVQLLRTYPRRRPKLPFAPDGERSIARGYAKALGRAQRLVYIEDQYLWSLDVARVFATALRRAPRLHLIAVVPRYPDQDGRFYRGPAWLGHAGALAMVHAAGGERVQVLDVQTADDLPVYVHSKVCIVDDVWAAVGSGNFNTRSWTHDSELTAAVLDSEVDERQPTDPGGLGDGARSFARNLRLQLLCEHLELSDVQDVLDPDRAAATVRDAAAALESWHADGRRGPRPPGRLRVHQHPPPPSGHTPGGPLERRYRMAGLAYRTVLDPDGRPWSMLLRRSF